MANLYYNAAVDTAWDTLGNWWNDAAFTDPALALPADGDDVYLAAQMTSGPSTSVTLNNIYVADSSTGGGNFGVDFTGAIGDATFRNSSRNTGTIGGNATVYYDGGSGQKPIGGTVGGTVTYIDFPSDYSTIYYTNASGDATWENLSNWNTAADGSGVSPTEVPWTNTDGSTNASNLFDASGGAGVTINYSSTIYSGVTGTCDISGITFNTNTIYGGTWTGDITMNYAYIHGGTYSGNINNPGGAVYGGLFTGSSFTNGFNTSINGGTFTCYLSNNGGAISGGTFTGSVDNSSDVYGYGVYGFIIGGTFTGSVTNESNCIIYGGTFSGSCFNYGIISGGTFSGSGFTNYSTINGGTFSGSFYNSSGILSGGKFISSAITVGTDGLGNTTLSLNGGPTLAYPTPAPSGGGNGLNLSQLLGLPSFIKI